MLDSLLVNLGASYSLTEASHGSFIEGRMGKIVVKGIELGFMGEIHPQVLQNWGLENPAAAFEINLNKLGQYLLEKT
jgi:phenylalanyl-tRNA synthetase beta chain